MRQIELFILGGYSRSTKMRHAVRDFEEGKITEIEFSRVLLQETAYLCGVQKGAGMTIIQDPMLEIQDIFRPFVESWRGVYYDGLLRYFDNNFFYRIPVFVDRPDIQKYYITRRVKLMRELNPDDRIKIVVPGPVTFAYLSKTELDRRELVFDILRLYQLDLSRAQEYRLDVLQLDEPILLDVDAVPEYCDLVEQYVKELKKTVQCKIGVALYFGTPRDDIVRKVVQLPVDFVCLNVCEHAGKYLEIFRKVKDSITTKIVLGIVDGRNIKPEEFEDIKKLVEEIMNVIGKESIVGFTTSTWLDLIPLRYAIEKTMLLGRYGLRLAELIR